MYEKNQTGIRGKRRRVEGERVKLKATKRRREVDSGKLMEWEREQRKENGIENGGRET